MLPQPLSFPYNSSLFRILTSCFENDLYELICKTAERWWCQKPAWLRILFLKSLNNYSRVRYIQGVKRFHEPVFYLSALTSSWWTEKSYRKKRLLFIFSFVLQNARFVQDRMFKKDYLCKFKEKYFSLHLIMLFSPKFSHQKKRIQNE